MAETVGQHSVAAFTSPVNGSTPIDANTVRGNDNTIRVAYVDHDADPGIHVQSSALASRPVAGTAGRKWMTVDGTVMRFWYDTGSTWLESQTSALSTARTLWGQSFDGTANVSGNLSSVGNIAMTGALSGATSVSATTLAGTLSTAAQPNVTSVGTLTSLTVTNPISGSITGSSGSTTGNAATATVLQTTRTLWGQNFNGSANVTGNLASVGTITGTAGVTLTATGATLALAATGANVITASTNSVVRLTLDASGNLGLGVTPSAWASTYRATQVGQAGAVFGLTNDQDRVGLTSNAYFDTTDNRWEYIGTGFATRYEHDAGQHQWFVAPSGVANAAVSFTQAMTLDANGNLTLVGDALASGFRGTVTTQTGSSYTIAATVTTVLANPSSGTQTLTLPTAVGITGRTYRIKRITATTGAKVLISTTSSQTIDGITQQELFATGAWIEVVSDGANWRIVGKQDTMPAGVTLFAYAVGDSLSAATFARTSTATYVAGPQ